MIHDHTFSCIRGRRVLGIALVLSACAGAAAGQMRPGSIYDPSLGPRNPIAAQTAFRKGDLLTVLVRESQIVRNQEASDLSRSTNLNYKINILQPEVFDPLPAIDADSSDSFIGSANYQKSGAFTAQLAAIVVDKMPNGNLVIAGRREIHVDNESKLIEFTGIVRIFDISDANTIESEQVANAKIIYKGSGPLTDTTNRIGIGGRIHRMLAWLWPF